MAPSGSSGPSRGQAPTQAQGQGGTAEEPPQQEHRHVVNHVVNFVVNFVVDLVVETFPWFRLHRSRLLLVKKWCGEVFTTWFAQWSARCFHHVCRPTRMHHICFYTAPRWNAK